MSNIEVSKQSIDDSNFPKGRKDEDFSPSVQAKFCGLPFPVSGVCEPSGLSIVVVPERASVTKRPKYKAKNGHTNSSKQVL